MNLHLRPVDAADFDVLFEMGKDPVAVYMAAFTSNDPADREAFDAQMTWRLTNPAIMNFTILAEGEVVGSVATFEVEGDREITYWLSRSAWGKGIAKWAVAEMLTLDPTRPIFGRAALDNVASQRVMESAGFKKIGTERAFANARGAEIEEVIFRLD